MALGFGFIPKWSEIVGHVVTSPHLKEFSKYSYSFMLKFWIYFIEMAWVWIFQKWSEIVGQRRDLVHIWRNFQNIPTPSCLKFDFISLKWHWVLDFPKNGQNRRTVVTSPNVKEFSNIPTPSCWNFWIYGHAWLVTIWRNFKIFLLHHVEILILFHWNGIGFWISKNGQKS